jgi:hypothetical protein
MLMAVANPVHRLTEAEYLEIERRAEFKSEFLGGVGLTIAVARVYAKVHFGPDPRRPATGETARNL